MSSPLFATAVDAYHQARDEWSLLVEAAYLRAEAATRGHLLNRRGREQGIDPRTLFYGSQLRATAYASEELAAHWREHPADRLPWADFEARWAAERQDLCPACQAYAS
jgi:hypothetical protein